MYSAEFCCLTLWMCDGEALGTTSTVWCPLIRVQDQQFNPLLLLIQSPHRKGNNSSVLLRSCYEVSSDPWTRKYLRTAPRQGSTNHSENCCLRISRRTTSHAFPTHHPPPHFSQNFSGTLLSVCIRKCLVVLFSLSCLKRLGNENTSQPVYNLQVSYECEE